jgi:hypothetical protein
VLRLDLLIPPFFASAALAVASGASKIRRPGPAARALEAAGLPSTSLAVRALGAAEIAIGSWCLTAPGRTSAVSLGLLYLAFAAFLARLMSTAGRDATCGCLGALDVPPSLLHVVLDLVGAGTSVAVAAAGPPQGVLAGARDLPFRGAPLLAGIILIAYLVYLTAAYLPTSFWSYGRGTNRATPARFALTPRSDR